MSEHVIVARMEGSGQTRISDRPILELPESMVLWTGEGDYEAWTGMDIATGKLVKMETPWVKDILDFDYWTDYFQSLDPSEWTCPGYPWPPNSELNPVSLQLIAAVPTFEPQGMALLVAVSTKRYGATCYLWFRGAGGELRRKRLRPLSGSATQEFKFLEWIWLTAGRGAVYLLSNETPTNFAARVSLPDMVEESWFGWGKYIGEWNLGLKETANAWGEILTIGVIPRPHGVPTEDQWGTRDVITDQVRLYPPASWRNLVAGWEEKTLSVDYGNDKVLPCQYGPGTETDFALLFLAKVSPDVAVLAVAEEENRDVYDYGVPKCGYSWGTGGPYPHWLVVPDIPGLCVEFPQSGGVDICFYGPFGIRYVATHGKLDPRGECGPSGGSPYYGIKRIPLQEALCYTYGVVNGRYGQGYSGPGGNALLVRGLRFQGHLEESEVGAHKLRTTLPSLTFRARSINLKTGRVISSVAWGTTTGTLHALEVLPTWGLLYDPDGKGGATVFPIETINSWGKYKPRILPLYVGARGTLSTLPHIPGDVQFSYMGLTGNEGYTYDEHGLAVPIPNYVPHPARFLKGRGTILPFKCFFPPEEARK